MVSEKEKSRLEGWLRVQLASTTRTHVTLCDIFNAARLDVRRDNLNQGTTTHTHALHTFNSVHTDTTLHGGGNGRISMRGTLMPLCHYIMTYADAHAFWEICSTFQIKFIYEGQPTLIVGNPLDRPDLTHEYLYGERYGIGLVLAGGNAGIGRYQMA